MIRIRCRDHESYDGQQKPDVGCDGCRFIRGLVLELPPADQEQLLSDAMLQGLLEVVE